MLLQQFMLNTQNEQLERDTDDDLRNLPHLSALLQNAKYYKDLHLQPFRCHTILEIYLQKIIQTQYLHTEQEANQDLIQWFKLYRLTVEHLQQNNRPLFEVTTLSSPPPAQPTPP